MENDENKLFIEKFHPEKFGFFDLTSFTNVDIGFNVKKKLNEKDNNNVSLLSIYISKRTYPETKNFKLPLSVHATYGRNAEGGGVYIRKNPKITEPIDLESANTYYYDVVSKEFLTGNKNITADDLLNEVYEKHIITTKINKGFSVIAYLWFWKVLIKNTFKSIFKGFYCLLFIISGDRFTYEPILETEKLNDKVIKSKFEKISNDMRDNLKESEKFDFLGYKASRWSIIFYSLLHFILYMVFFFIGYKPIFLTTILKNNFLLLIYVILTLWIIEVAMTKIFKIAIRFFSKLSFKAEFKTIRL